ncbi:hypothetical protein [Vreelandella venusta]|uniref:hypothetical protein n=1 Tax=Vreelandella venusta TaxID=44935 RepID=UPI0018DA5071|nr:hypothetical protein [Halomonas venusta]QPI65898.1 hypothetical protein IR195_09470 [Halomonas venusta]
MFSTKRPKLGTSMEDGWMYYHIQELSSYLIDEYFRVGIYKRLLNDSRMNRNGRDVHDFKKRMQSENFHSIYAHSFIGQWSAFESGLDNNIAAILKNDEEASRNALRVFRKPKYSIEQWPWDSDSRIHLAQMLGRCAKSKPENTSSQSQVLINLYSFLGVSLVLDENHSLKLDEANRVRNILLHRSGEVMPKDAQDFPTLKVFEGGLYRMTDPVFNDYHSAIVHFLTSLIRAISERGFNDLAS